MKHKLVGLYRNIKRINTSLKTNGVKYTIQKVKLHLQYREKSPIFDLISLVPVKNPWNKRKKTSHRYDLSVIIPTYNRAHMLPQLLDSWKEVDRATNYSYEIIISDDGSDDNSIAILEYTSDLPLKILKNEHGGASKARNTAIKAAEGEKLLIIGDDIFPNPQIINQHIEKLRELSITDAVLGECLWHPELEVNHLMDHITELGCEQFSFSRFPKHGFTDFRHFYTCNISIDREFLLSEKTIFDESFYKYGFEDIELGYRLAKKGMKIYYYPEAYGDHLHPYYDVRKFCNRQESAGEMALVFKRLHPEIEPIVDINNTLQKWSPYLIPQELREEESIYEQLILFCQYIEDSVDTRNSDFSKDLSILYTLLFRFAYEKGVCSQTNERIEYRLNALFNERFVSEKFRKALKHLFTRCNVPNFDILNALMDHRSHAMALLTIEAEDGEHLDELIQRYDGFGRALRFRLKSQISTDGIVYKPEKGFYLHKNSIRQILFFLHTHSDIDVILLSFSLTDLPYIGIVNSYKNSCICSSPIYPKKGLIHLDRISKGKIIRIFECADAKKVPLRILLDQEPAYLDDYGYFGGNATHTSSYYGTALVSATDGTKPTIFVFPTFLAVGGVERNTVEIINRLRDKYEFIVVTFERLRESHGSLHHQFLESCGGIYDLTELSTHDRLSEYLRLLNDFYAPQLIWICNGSPWLANNTMQIRHIFETSAIVDQEVYDTEAGWIQLYKEGNSGLLRFNRFIAINSKIRDIFVNTVGIDQKYIDLIYSVMSTDKRESAILNNRNALCQKFGLENTQKYFVFIGRLTEQKAPQDLLKLISSIIDKYGETYKFILVGSGELGDSISQYIDTHHLSNHIVRFDYIDNTFEISMVAEAILFTSLFEGLSIALLEALSVGTPALSTDVGDTKLLFDTYKNGMTFQTIGNTAEYFRTFEQFIDNYPFYKENAEKYKSEIAEKFSPNHIASLYQKCFNAALDSLEEPKI